MSIQRLTEDDFELFTIETNPKRTYSSSSSGITGSVNLFARRTVTEKELYPLSLFSESFYRDGNLDELRKSALTSTSSNINAELTDYLSAIRSQQSSSRKEQKVEVIRFQPPFSLNSNFLRKKIVKNLFQEYRVNSPSYQYAINNYHTLNFFTASNVPNDSVMLYPNVGISRSTGVGSQYQISGGFSFDFFIKPRYTTDTTSSAYKAGTIMHLTSAYSLTLHTGSSRDQNGYPNKYKIALAVGSDADVAPSQMTTSSLTFWSTDNALDRNKWHHVTVRWNGENYNFGSGSIIIDDDENATFRITQSLELGFYDGSNNPSVLCIGNYYEGSNAGTDALSRFFAADTATREGLEELNGTAGVYAPDTFTFDHPLNAEVYDLKLYSKYLNVNEIAALRTGGPETLNHLQFYLPPFFTEESPFRQSLNGFGGELVTPFFERDASTDTPFAGRMAFSCGGMYINLENYVRDFASNRYPRLWVLTGSTFTPPSTTILSCNDFLFATGSNRRRQYTILPNDNGDFIPNFDLMDNLSGSKLVNDLGNKNIGLVTLNNIVEDTFVSRGIVSSGTILNEVLGARPDSITSLPGNSLAILHRTRDSSSNQVVLFDISNLFYGMQIKPGSIVLTDPLLDHSEKIGITIKDDGYGNLYRADVTGSHPSWSSIGNVFYNEGIILIKSPQLYFFGEDQFNIEFKGQQNIHTLTINAFSRPMMQTSSSNPSFQRLSASTNANDTDDKFVYITGINIHDENLNVISRTTLAQPMIKRSGDKYLFKIKMDY